MEEKLLILVIILILLILVVLIWNNNSLDKLRKILKEGSNQIPADNYFELKYKIQFLTFSFSLIVITAGLIGYNSINAIKVDIYKDITISANKYSARLDSLNNKRFNQIDTINKTVVESISNLKSLQELHGYNQFFVVNSLIIESPKPIEIIKFKDIGFEDFETVPTIFIQSKNKSRVTVLNVTKSQFTLEISSKKVVDLSLMIFY